MSEYPGFGIVLGIRWHAGAVLATRYLNWMSPVEVLYGVSLGCVYWSGATVGLVGRGRGAVTPWRPCSPHPSASLRAALPRSAACACPRIPGFR
jgi:hypothetical protein